MTIKLKAIIIGSTNLCTTNITYLIENNFDILGVIALDNVVKNYCNNNDIRLIAENSPKK
jgi:hypothetical protein